jgi:hypothetical protein
MHISHLAAKSGVEASADPLALVAVWLFSDVLNRSFHSWLLPLRTAARMPT